MLLLVSIIVLLISSPILIFGDSHEVISNRISVDFGNYENKTEPITVENKTMAEPVNEPIETETSKPSTASSGGSGVTMSPKVCGLELCDDTEPIEPSETIFRGLETPKAVITETNEIITIPSQSIETKPIPTIPESMPREPIPNMITSPEPIIDPPVNSNGEPLNIFDVFIAWLISIWMLITGQS